MRSPSPAIRLALGLALCGTIAAPARAKDRAVDDVRRGLPPGLQLAPSLGGDSVHNVGAIQLLVTNFGLLGSLPGTRAPYSDAPSAQWPPSSGVDYLYGAGLWVGALVDDQPHVTGIVQTPERIQFEFRPGSSDLDRIYRSRELAPHGARLPSPNADDDGDGRIDEDRLDGRDNDGDGRVDEDFAGISNQMFVCEYEDTDPSIRLAVPDHRPLGLHVEQTTLAWEGDAANSFIGLDYRITNVGRDLLQAPCVGFYADFDIGSRQRGAAPQDDRVGYWSGERDVTTGGRTRSVHLEVGYAFDDDGDDGQAEGYIGIVFLGYERDGEDSVRPLALRNYRTFLGTGGFDSGGDPTNDADRYAVLDGSAPRSLPESAARRSYTLRVPGDYRSVYSAGPFPPLAPGAALRFQAALVIGRGLDDLLAHATEALLTLHGVWLDRDGDPRTGVDGREKPLCAPANSGRTRIDPCNARCEGQDGPPCQQQVPPEGCLWVNGDCQVEVETGETTGVDGRECHVTWLADSPPTPPAMRLVPYEDRVEILWDDRSETTPDLIQGATDFESYRIWRAEGWDRPFGTNERSGPAPELWSLLGEFDVAGNGIGSDTGLDALHYEPHVPASLVGFYRNWFALHPGEPPPDVEGFTSSALDTAQALARGRHYYRFVDPPFLNAAAGESCPPNGLCAPMRVGNRMLQARCDAAGRCRPTTPPPHPGMHLFYAVTATDHRMHVGADGSSALVAGLAGEPAANFAYVVQPSTALPAARADAAESEIYVVPNPATPATLAAWRLQPNNDDPTGVKVEFHHLPQSTGKVTIWTLSGDRVRELSFDARAGNGTLAWDLVSRNGQDVASGVYLYSVESDDAAFRRVVGKLVVIR